MIIVNTSFHLMARHEAEFIDWAKNRYMAAAKASGLFDETLLIKILTEIDPQVRAYSVQLRGASLEQASQWLDDEAAQLRGELTARYGEEIVYFSTHMEVLES